MDYDYDDEPDLDFGFECDSAFESAGWGTDEDYGYYGDPLDDLGEAELVDLHED